MTPELRKELRRSGLVAITNRENADYLKIYGFAPDVVVDIGVDKGTRGLYGAFPDAHFVLVDPRPDTEETLTWAPRQYDFIPCAAGASAGRMSLQTPVTADGPQTARAGFRPISSPMKNSVIRYETRDVPVHTLDEIMEDYQGRVGIKIDTEGYELDVLKGAKETLRRTEFVILELSLTKRFEGVAAPGQVIAELAGYDLELRDILSLPGDGRGGPAPRYVDALFTKWNET